VRTLDDHPFAGRVVLVVDDDYRNALALWALLDRGHADVSVAQSGFEAIDILEHAPRTDLVLMDIMMPGMDGYATMEAIRTRERFRTLPIIAVTAKVTDNERRRCIAAGADDYVPKPIETALLLSVMEPLLSTTTPL
jgi:CheY-like chemotaxis protein